MKKSFSIILGFFVIANLLSTAEPEEQNSHLLLPQQHLPNLSLAQLSPNQRQPIEIETVQKGVKKMRKCSKRSQLGDKKQNSKILECLTKHLRHNAVSSENFQQRFSEKEKIPAIATAKTIDLPLHSMRSFLIPKNLQLQRTTTQELEEMDAQASAIEEILGVFQSSDSIQTIFKNSEFSPYTESPLQSDMENSRDSAYDFLTISMEFYNDK